MKKLLLGLMGAGLLVLGLLISVPSVGSLRAQSDDPKPTCNMCPGTYIPVGELDAYTKKAIAEKRIDQQVRDVDIGKAHIGIGMVYRGKLDAPAKVSGRARFGVDVNVPGMLNGAIRMAPTLNGKPLGVPNGAPLRLRVERQLGYKQAKYLQRIEITDSFRNIAGGYGGYWEDRGYEWYAGI